MFIFPSNARKQPHDDACHMWSNYCNNLKANDVKRRHSHDAQDVMRQWTATIERNPSDAQRCAAATSSRSMGTALRTKHICAPPAGAPLHAMEQTTRMRNEIINETNMNTTKTNISEGISMIFNYYIIWKCIWKCVIREREKEDRERTIDDDHTSDADNHTIINRWGRRSNRKNFAQYIINLWSGWAIGDR